MAPLFVQIVSTLLARWFAPWMDAARIGMAIMFFFTAGSHFSSLRDDIAAMIPPPLTGALWMVYLTGVLEGSRRSWVTHPVAAKASGAGTGCAPGRALSGERICRPGRRDDRGVSGNATLVPHSAASVLACRALVHDTGGSCSSSVRRAEASINNRMALSQKPRSWSLATR